MLTIREAQNEAFRRAARERFAQGLTSHLLAHYPRECRQAGGRPAVADLVSLGMSRAAEHGFRSEALVGRHVSLMFMLGVDFDRDPQLPWAAELLDDPSFDDPVLRMDQAFHAAMEYLRETAGAGAELVVRAMVRARSFELERLPQQMGERWEPSMLAIFEWMYPEKHEVQGDDAARALGALAVTTAAGYGITRPANQGLFFLLMFMMGSGFAHDPLQPWAARVLGDRSIRDEDERTVRLHQGSLEHLAGSLTSA